MAGFVDTIITSFKQTINWPMWLYFFIILFIEVLVTGIIALIFVFIGFLTLLGPINAFGGIENIGMLFLNPSFITASIGVIGLLFIAFLLIAAFIEAIFTGIRYNLFNDFLKTGKFNLGKSFQKTKPRFFTFFIISLITALVIVAVFAIAFSPLLFIIPNLINGLAGTNAGLVIAPLLFGLILAFLAAIVILLISPMLGLLAPAAFFEENGAIATIKKAFELMKANYFGNLAYVILYFLIIFAIRMLLQALILPFTFLFSFIEYGGAAAVGLLAFAGIIVLIIMLVCIIWSTVFDVACFRNLYFLDKSLLPRPSPKHSAKPRHRAKKKKARKKSK